MNKVYVVVYSEGSYDSFYQYNAGVFLSKPSAEKFIEETKTRIQREHVESEYLADFAREYMLTHPMPSREAFIPYPPISSDNMKEREKILQKNQRSSLKYSMDISSYHAEVLRAQVEFAEKNGYLIPETAIYSQTTIDKDGAWEIEEHELFG